MKRKRLDRDAWRRITGKRYAQRAVDASFFKGDVALLHIDRVSERNAWNIGGAEVSILEEGMLWLQFAPAGENDLVTAMMGGDKIVRAWYVDVIAGVGYGGDGVLYFDDLYADLIFAPEGFVLVDDLDELDQARAAGEITDAQHATALRTVAHVRETLCADREGRAVARRDG